MAVRGPKPKAPYLKLLEGNPGSRPLFPDENSISGGGKPVPPVELEGRPLELWERYIATAGWLQEHDSPKAYMWVMLQADFEAAPGDMSPAKIGQLRALGSELGLDPSSRARMQIAPPKPPGDPGEEFFD